LLIICAIIGFKELVEYAATQQTHRAARHSLAVPASVTAASPSSAVAIPPSRLFWRRVGLSLAGCCSFISALTRAMRWDRERYERIPLIPQCLSYG
jgi:hypothetical protein